MEIFKLFGSILINSDEADNSLAKTDDKAKSVASSLGSGIKTAAKFGAAIVGAATTAATGMYKMATESASTADEIDKMSQKIGVSREGYQELAFALSQSGADVNGLKTGLKTLSQQAEQNNAYFEQLGISLTDVNGNAKDQETLFYEVVNALQQMESGTEKTTIATKLLGKQGTELMPLLNQEAGSLDALRQQAHDLGLVLDDDVISNGVTLTDTLDQVKRSLGTVMTQLGAKLMPVVKTAADFILKNMPKINGLIEKITPIFESAFDQILPVLINLAETLLPQVIEIVTALLPPLSQIFQQLAPIISQLIEKLAPVIVKIIEKLMPPLLDALDALMPLLDVVFELLDPILDLVLALLDPIADILGLLSPILKVATDIIKTVLEPIMPLIKNVTEYMSKYLGSTIESVTDIVEGLLNMFKGVIEFWTGDWETGLSDWASGFENVVSGTLSFIDGLFGTHLADWYNEVTAFWKDAGAKLYEVFHADEIAATADSIEVSNIRSDIIQTSNEYMRQGMSAADALAKAKNEILNTSEKLALFNSHLADEITEQEATQRQNTLRSTGQISSTSTTPHLATGGVVYGKTLAVVGDNSDARSNPEVVAPLSELQNIMNSSEVVSELKTVTRLLTEILKSGNTTSINIDGQKLATVVTDKINGMRYIRGAEVVYS